MATCTGCSLLCDDIEVEAKDGALAHAKNLCRKGHGHFRSAFSEMNGPMIDGQKVDLKAAIAGAAEILKNAKRPLLFGWSNCTLEAQRAGIELAERLGAIMDDTHSFGQGILMERLLSGAIPTCTLDDVRNYADLSLFWGSDPSNSHPRHLSRFAYYPRGDKRQKSYEEERTCVVVDVRRSPTAQLCSDYYHRVAPGGDAEFMQGMLSVLDGRVPKVADKKKLIELVNKLKKAEWGVIFPGPGLLYSRKEQMDLFEALVTKLNEITAFKVIPMLEHYNARGFNELLRERTGFINRVSFQAGSTASAPEYGVLQAVKSADAALVIGSDPLSALPAGSSRALAKIPMIAIDPHRSLTTGAAKVVIPSAMSGIFAGGSAIRMDGRRIEFEAIVQSGIPSDEQVLRMIMEAI